MIINSFFANGGVPAIGLTPTIRIWEVAVAIHTLVIIDESMVEVGDGFYKYHFASYDPTKQYVIRSNGGGLLSTQDRFNIGATEELKLEDQTINNITSGVWDEQQVDHIDAGSMGFTVAQIKADTAAILISETMLHTLVETLLKYSRNRTKIDVGAATLTIYDDDCTSILHVFNLKDAAGMPSVAEVCERRPSTC